MLLDLSDSERAALIAALQALVDRDPQRAKALMAILDKLEPHKSRALPDNASTG